MKDILPILLAEDSLADAEMAIDALREANLANAIVHVEDGVEAMEYLLRQGAFAAGVTAVEDGRATRAVTSKVSGTEAGERYGAAPATLSAVLGLALRGEPEQLRGVAAVRRAIVEQPRQGQRQRDLQQAGGGGVGHR